MTEAKGLDRRAVVRALVAERGETLAITGLGSSAYDLYAAGDHDANFYLWGAMGAAAMMGLGLALAQPMKPVLVITGDGEQLMAMGAFATIGVQRPPNLSLVVLDNGHFGETGMQESHTTAGVDLAAVASACSFAWSETIKDAAALAGLVSKIGVTGGPGFARILINADTPPRALPSRDGVYLKNRVRLHLGLEV